MTKQELKEKMKENHEVSLKTLEILPDFLKLSSVEGKQVFTSGYYPNLKEMQEDLHLCREIFGNYELRSYYDIWGSLSVHYIFKNGLEIVFYVRNTEASLKELTNGKCHVEKTTREETTIVCEA